MKQVFQNLRTGETSVVDVPVPTPPSGAALVRVAASLVSAGTERLVVEFGEKSLLGKARSRPDLARQVIDKARREGLLTTLDSTFNRLDQPLPLGYSSAGTIVALGAGLHGYQVGQRVACAGGGYAVHAEYDRVPSNLLASLPDSVDFESAAFTTLGAIALHGFRLAEPGLGASVAVIGLGLLGLLVVGIASAAGCRVLGIDLDAKRVALARQMGAHQSVNRQEAETASLVFSRGRGCDAILICADTPSTDPVELAGAIARDRARVVAIGAVGLALPRKVYYEKELSFINSRSYGPGRYDPGYEENGHDYPLGYVRWTEGRNLEAFVDLLSTQRLDVHPLITHRFPISQASQAYDLITGKRGEPFLGVLLTYPESGIEMALPVKIEAEQTQRSREHKTVSSTAVKLGVLGAGNFATAVLLPVIHKIPQLELVGIASGSGLSARHIANRYGFQYATGDENQVLNDPDINTIAILTRHHLHASQVLTGLRAGKHVFCEKPLALNQSELDEIFSLLAAQQASCPLLTVGFNRRYAPLAKKLKDFIDQRKEPLVAHYRINAGYLPLNHWLHDPNQGGGRIIGEGCHFIDFLTFLVGEAPNSVSGVALPDAGYYRQDNIALTFTFRDGSLGTIHYLANGDKSFPKERLEVFAGGRVAVLDDFRMLELVHTGQRDVLRSRLRQDKGYLAEWETLLNAIRTAGPPPIRYSDLSTVSQASFAAVKALQSGQPITIQTVPQ